MKLNGIPELILELQRPQNLYNAETSNAPTEKHRQFKNSHIVLRILKLCKIYQKVGVECFYESIWFL